MSFLRRCCDRNDRRWNVYERSKRRAWSTWLHWSDGLTEYERKYLGGEASAIRAGVVAGSLPLEAILNLNLDLIIGEISDADCEATYASRMLRNQHSRPCRDHYCLAVLLLVWLGDISALRLGCRSGRRYAESRC